MRIMPPIEIREDKDKIVITAYLPAAHKDNIEVIVDDDKLIISGEIKQENTKNADGVIYSEVYYGKFSRAIPLPEGVDVSNAKAKFDNGVLVVEIPLSEPRKGRRLKIE